MTNLFPSLINEEIQTEIHIFDLTSMDIRVKHGLEFR